MTEESRKNWEDKMADPIRPIVIIPREEVERLIKEGKLKGLV